jgi:hypothetical protein
MVRASLEMTDSYTKCQVLTEKRERAGASRVDAANPRGICEGGPSDELPCERTHADDQNSSI